MSAAEDAIKKLLDSVASPADLADGYNLFLGPEQAPESGTERAAVFILDTGNGDSYRFGGTSTDYRTYSVQVVVRASHYDYAGGQSLAQACWDALNHAAIAEWIYCLPQQSGPVYVGEDDQRQHRWSLNFSLARTV